MECRFRSSLKRCENTSHFLEGLYINALGTAWLPNHYEALYVPSDRSPICWLKLGRSPTLAQTSDETTEKNIQIKTHNQAFP
ncbi:hypothetical protein Tco_0824387 [Tanacetum coccineum]|uniref:Uncharacterized protein n=1 Tax=Tanacetum coccineum TaxID=301880 RepID=A0ABQ5ALJ8_9ASTR